MFAHLQNNTIVKMFKDKDNKGETVFLYFYKYLSTRKLSLENVYLYK